MKIEAIYDNGKLKFLSPLKFAHHRFTVKVDVPDSEVLMQSDTASHIEASQTPHAGLPAEVQAIAERMKDDLQRLRNAPLPPDDELPPLTQKQLDRMAAFALREDR